MYPESQSIDETNVELKLYRNMEAGVNAETWMNAAYWFAQLALL